MQFNRAFPASGTSVCTTTPTVPSCRTAEKHLFVSDSLMALPTGKVLLTGHVPLARLLAAALVFQVACVAVPDTVSACCPAPAHKPGTLLLLFEPGMTVEEVSEIVRGLGASLEHYYGFIHGCSVRIPVGHEEKFIELFEQNPRITGASRNGIYCIPEDSLCDCCPSSLVCDRLPPCGEPWEFQCAGDCNGNGKVTVDELITGVRIALGGLATDVCPAIDTDGDGMVHIDELVAPVVLSLNDCPQW